MTTPFRQVIRPGQAGKDVLAVKRAMVAMRAPGFEELNLKGEQGKVAGSKFVVMVDEVLRSHGKKQDHTYGREAHAIIAPHFDLYGAYLYRSAALRYNDPPVGAPAWQEAAALLRYHEKGKYTAYNSGDLADIQRSAKGLAVWSQGGRWVHVDKRVFASMVMMIQRHGSIGTYAICSDHHFDGWHGHSGGLAWDLTHIGGTPVASGSARQKVLTVLNEFHMTSGPLHPWQLISGGYGYRYDSACRALCLPGAEWYYGSTTLAQHENHVHIGYE